jgi:hypothetical protein
MHTYLVTSSLALLAIQCFAFVLAILTSGASTDVLLSSKQTEIIFPEVTVTEQTLWVER